MSKPMIQAVDDLAEGVYMASGDNMTGQSDGCYTASWEIRQTPETGRDNYCFQVNGKHHADHTKETQWLHISFNMPVEYISSKGTLESGDGTTTLVIRYNYHQNPTDNIGLGDLYVKADQGLAVTAVSITD